MKAVRAEISKKEEKRKPCLLKASGLSRAVRAKSATPRPMLIIMNAPQKPPVLAGPYRSGLSPKWASRFHILYSGFTPRIFQSISVIDRIQLAGLASHPNDSV